MFKYKNRNAYIKLRLSSNLPTYYVLYLLYYVQAIMVFCKETATYKSCPFTLPTLNCMYLFMLRITMFICLFIYTM